MQILVVEFQMTASEEVFYVSAATIWEIAVKSRLGKVNPGTKHLDQRASLDKFVSQMGHFPEMGQLLGKHAHLN